MQAEESNMTWLILTLVGFAILAWGRRSERRREELEIARQLEAETKRVAADADARAERARQRVVLIERVPEHGARAKAAA
jgi:hypothetical protein